VTRPGHRIDLSLLFRALRFAADHHRHDRRKGADASPYINHPIAVASELVDVGIVDPEVLAAALLHDTVEDTIATSEEIQREFGPRVRELVDAVTDDKNLRSGERKRLQVAHAPNLDPDAKRIKISDKICNARDVGHSPAAGWSLERRREYLDWTERVVAGCRGVNPALEARYDEVLADSRSRLAVAAAEAGE
jgi:guanosine-3',5'-bis(diphosphate) 3'-pyrophosphohydrolase